MCNYYDKLSSKYNVEYIESNDTNHDKIINTIINKNKMGASIKNDSNVEYP